MKRKKIKIGDTVRLISLKQQRTETYNWILDSTNNPNIGDEFIVNEVSEDGWIRVDGLLYSHPPIKFELI